MLDLDGDGVARGDGCPSTDEAEEFFASDLDSSIAFDRHVRTGSRAAGAPNGPLRVGVFFDGELDPDTVASFRSVALGHARTDGPIRIVELDRARAGVAAGGDLDAFRVPVRDLRVARRFVPSLGRSCTFLDVEIARELLEESEHRIEVALETAGESGGGALPAFGAVFRTGIPHGRQDRFVELFESRAQRDAATTAIWRGLDRPYLQAGVGWGGDGSDGELVVSGTRILNTADHPDGFDFTNIRFEGIDPVLLVRGPHPAVIRVFGSLKLLTGTEWIFAGGRRGFDGIDAEEGMPLRGGAGGPGGGSGGVANPDGVGMDRAGPGLGPEGTAVSGGLGGESTSAPGGGGGGGHRTTGLDGRNGSTAEGGDGGAGGEAYGSVDEFVGGAGGGAGGSVPASPPVAGGSGGGGGGALRLEVRDDLFLRIGTGLVSVNGGNGGAGVLVGDARSGGGAGGAGGFAWIRARRFAGLSGTIEALGGRNGVANGDAGRGGRGADGRILLESLSPRSCPNCDPAPTIREIPENVVGKTFGRSEFYVTGHAPGQTIWSFDASDPATGEVTTLDGVEDLALVDGSGNPLSEIPDGVRIGVRFSGADPSPLDPSRPLPASVTPFFTDISRLDGYPLVRFEVRFQVDPALIEADGDLDLPAVDRLVIRFRR